MSEKLAIKIFKQFDFEIEMCEKCPRKKEKERTCIGCLENAKEILLNYIEQLQQEHNILTEFEKWLEIKLINTFTKDDMTIGYKKGLSISLEKLQELKEGVKNE